MSTLAVQTRIDVTRHAFLHAQARYDADPSDRHAFDLEAAALNYHFALTTIATW